MEPLTLWQRGRGFRGNSYPLLNQLLGRIRVFYPLEAQQDLPMPEKPGCRYGELVAIRTADFNPDAGTVLIRHSKSGKARHVVLTDEGQGFFETITAGREDDKLVFTKLRGKPWGRTHQQQPLRKACQRAGITPPANFHVLRHTYASLLVMAGVPLVVVAKNLGHSDTRMCERHYAHLAPSYLADTIRAHAPKLGIAGPGKVTPLKINTAANV